MEATVKNVNGVTVVKIIGDLPGESQKEFKGLFDDLMAGGATKIVVDCKKVSFCSVASLQVILAVLKPLRKKGGLLRICVGKEVKTKLAMFRVNQFLEVFQCVEDALRF